MHFPATLESAYQIKRGEVKNLTLYLCRRDYKYNLALVAWL